MKQQFTFAYLITLILFTFHTQTNAQKQDCIICPEMLGLATNTEHGVNISTLTPSPKTTIIASSEEEKNAKTNKSNKSAKKANRQKNTKNKKNTTIVVEDENDDIMGFADAGSSNDAHYQVESSDEYSSGDDCGCSEVNETGDVIIETEKTFTLYPNPAHHWVIINAEHLDQGDYKIFLKDLQGNIIKERTLTDSETTKLDLQRMKKGVYFVTLRNESNHNTWIQKVTVQ